jgi:tetratricopeptide (TPR) repeat protein
MPSANVPSLDEALRAHRAGQFPVAERLYRQILAAEPRSADAWHLLGALCLQSGRAAEAVEAIRRAVEIGPATAEYYDHLGAAYGAMRDHASAIATLRRAVQMNPQSASAHYNLGTVLRNDGQLEPAVASFRHAVAADPRAAEAHYNLANTLRELGRTDEAEAAYRQALAARPRYLKAMINLGNLLGELGRRQEAIDVLEAAVALDPKYARSRVNLGSVLRDLGRYDDAVACLRAAVALDPRSAEGFNNLGTALQARGEFDEAYACYEQALELDPQLPDAHFSRATRLLRQRDLERGFAEYEWRWKCKSFSRRRFDVPRWNGEPLGGRTILLHAEQGLGDTLQFVRYAADVARRGGRVLVECPEPLVPLLRSCAGIEQLIPSGQGLPPFDCHCPLMSLPGVLGLSIAELARGTYLSVEPARVAAWRDSLAALDGLRIGVCWQGNPRHLFDAQRSFPLAMLAPLAAVEGVRLVSLQKGAGSEQLAGCGFDVLDLGDELDREAPFLDTAAVIENLDLVVTADTATLHLAGGLGAPTWVALSAHADWRWFVDSADSPWYPSVRLFRQRRLDQWADVFARMAAELPGIHGRKKNPRTRR